MSRLALAKKGLIEIWVWHGLARSLAEWATCLASSVRARAACRKNGFVPVARSVGVPSPRSIPARFIWERKSLPISVISVASAAEEGRMHLLGRLLHQVASAAVRGKMNICSLFGARWMLKVKSIAESVY